MPVVRLLVRGRVQGVGFRWHVREAARSAGLAGWVRNRFDGSVEVLADGAEDRLDQLRAAVRAGPPGAVVASVDESIVAPGEPLPSPFGMHR